MREVLFVEVRCVSGALFTHSTARGRWKKIPTLIALSMFLLISLVDVTFRANFFYFSPVLKLRPLHGATIN